MAIPVYGLKSVSRGQSQRVFLHHQLQETMYRSVRVAARRFQSTGSFKNTHNFNTNPPPVHEYWNIRNSAVLLAFVPIYVAVGYIGKNSGEGLTSLEALKAAADSDLVKDLGFGEAQRK